MNNQKPYEKIKASQTNLKISDFIRLIQATGFDLKNISGSHHIFVHPLVPNIINVQPNNGQAKVYQVRQVMKLIEMHNLKVED